MKIGFIGLGSQGAPMATRLIDAGHPVVLWARRPESLEPYAGTAAETAGSIEELGAQCEHVGICVVDDAGVRQICDALIPAMAAGGRIAIHSTVHPDTCRALSKQAASRGLSLIDAPVSGGAPAAEVGKLTVMVGGEEQAVGQARPLFEAFGEAIVHLGDVGAGQMAKLVNNTLMAAHVALAHHAVAVSSELGIDQQALKDLVNVSSGRSFGFEVYSRLPDPSAFSHGARLLEKDVNLLGDLAGDDADYNILREAAFPFLDQILQKA